ncbi:MAG TPA: ribbon-helix-helix domain-containing protein [Candidatus Saccharimonadales bacterium]|nr:ribbon-helix-helix domain-containing protein [Candidatus Saccharimonadales bacterium]
MKTAISIPDNVYESAEKLANHLGKSRSQLYTQAINNFIAKHQREDVTKKLNKVYTTVPSNLDETLSKLQFSSLPKEEW